MESGCALTKFNDRKMTQLTVSKQNTQAALSVKDSRSLNIQNLVPLYIGHWIDNDGS